MYRARLPALLPRRLGAARAPRLPGALGELVEPGREHRRELPRRHVPGSRRRAAQHLVRSHRPVCPARQRRIARRLRQRHLDSAQPGDRERSRRGSRRVCRVLRHHRPGECPGRRRVRARHVLRGRVRRHLRHPVGQRRLLRLALLGEHPRRSLPFTNLPFQLDAQYASGENWINQGYFGEFDGFTTVAGHEYAESVTDPFPDSGWDDTADAVSGGEIADKCAWGGAAFGGHRPGGRRDAADRDVRDAVAVEQRRARVRADHGAGADRHHPGHAAEPARRGFRAAGHRRHQRRLRARRTARAGCRPACPSTPSAA